jgi:hypothetical protein
MDKRIEITELDLEVLKGPETIVISISDDANGIICDGPMKYLNLRVKRDDFGLAHLDEDACNHYGRLDIPKWKRDIKNIKPRDQLEYEILTCEVHGKTVRTLILYVYRWNETYHSKRKSYHRIYPSANHLLSDFPA